MHKGYTSIRIFIQFLYITAKLGIPFFISYNHLVRANDLYKQTRI